MMSPDNFSWMECDVMCITQAIQFSLSVGWVLIASVAACWIENIISILSSLYLTKLLREDKTLVPGNQGAYDNIHQVSLI